MVTVSIQPHAIFGSGDYRKDAPHFISINRFKINFQNELAEQVRQLEQAIDDLERKNRQLVESYEQAEELNQIEMERNALLETEISHGEKLKEVIQRLKDEKRDLKSELENKGHG